MYLLFDVGGTNTRVAVSQNGRSLKDVVIFKTSKNYKQGLENLIMAGKALAGGNKIKAVAGGMAGILSLDKKKIFVAPNLPKWNRQPIYSDLHKAFRCPVLIENDADMAGLGEAHYGAGKGYGIIGYLTISTGIGGCRVTDGRLDKSYLGFEPGFQIVEYKKRNLTYFEPYTDNKKLAVGIHNAIVFWSPEILILGGGRMNDPKIKISGIKKQLKKTLAIFPKLPEIKKAELGDLGGLFGALLLIKR
ncbi:ROK family protein [Patescibacteria group bacterium]|nr:ROK family protein [Patescibacteria group bacterium]MBU1673525.1 ROK family protein [Patescibacteria group bacterium]MBU1963709.1 ROK family protein [Patescibacteria group bacterium]